MFDELTQAIENAKTGTPDQSVESAIMVYLAAQAEIQHEGPELADFPGAQRLLKLRLLQGRWRPAALPLRWSAPELAPQFLPA